MLPYSYVDNGYYMKTWGNKFFLEITPRHEPINCFCLNRTANTFYKAYNCVESIWQKWNAILCLLIGD